MDYEITLVGGLRVIVSTVQLFDGTWSASGIDEAIGEGDTEAAAIDDLIDSVGGVKIDFYG